MGLDPRGFMDGAFRGFQMMESHYDRQDRKQERTDSLRRADEINTENQRRYDAQIARQDERQIVDDQRYNENRTREDKNQVEEKAWRAKAHEDNKELYTLRYTRGGRYSSGRTGGSNNGKEYRGAVTKLMNWKHDKLAKIDPYLKDKERNEAVKAINSQYNARLNDVKSLYVTPEPTPKGDVPVPPPNGEQSYYSAWADNPIKQKFLADIQDRGANLDNFDTKSLDHMYTAAKAAAVRLQNESKASEDANFIRSIADKAAATASSIELPRPISLRSASEVMDQAAMQNYSNALAGNTRPQFSAPVLNAGIVDGVEAGAELAVKTGKQIAADTALYVREQNKKALESAGKNSTATPHQTYY